MTTETTDTGAPISNDTADVPAVPADAAEWFERIHVAQLHDNPTDQTNDARYQ